MKFLACFVLAVFLVSCDKKDALTEGSGLVDRIIVKLNSVTGELRYSYDANGKVIGTSYKELSPDTTVTAKEIWLRNNGGEIKNAKKYSLGNLVEEIEVVYHPGNSQIRYFIKEHGTKKDSSAVIYNNNFVVADHFRFNDTTGQYNPFGKTSFEFQNGNLATLKFFTTNLSTPTRQIEYTYDSNIGPYTSSVNDIVVLNAEALSLRNNILVRKVTFPLNGWLPYDITHSYTYLPSGRLSSSTINDYYGVVSIQYFYK